MLRNFKTANYVLKALISCFYFYFSLIESFFLVLSLFCSLNMGICDDLSHCKLALAFAVLMDLLGGVSLLVGVFASLEFHGQEFGDLLVYSGIYLNFVFKMLTFFAEDNVTILFDGELMSY